MRENILNFPNVSEFHLVADSLSRQHAAQTLKVECNGVEVFTKVHSIERGAGGDTQKSVMRFLHAFHVRDLDAVKNLREIDHLLFRDEETGQKKTFEVRLTDTCSPATAIFTVSNEFTD
jgi:hypothetical protein